MSIVICVLFIGEKFTVDFLKNYIIPKPKEKYRLKFSQYVELNNV